ncbi:MAG: hypothetical protein LAO51_14730 [Acidobacteriia bacterium]|nr:hypothetical protein [Terriglobia bacterium]
MIQKARTHLEAWWSALGSAEFAGGDVRKVLDRCGVNGGRSWEQMAPDLVKTGRTLVAAAAALQPAHDVAVQTVKAALELQRQKVDKLTADFQQARPRWEEAETASARLRSRIEELEGDARTTPFDEADEHRRIAGDLSAARSQLAAAVERASSAGDVGEGLATALKAAVEDLAWVEEVHNVLTVGFHVFDRPNPDLTRRPNGADYAAQS